MKNTKMYLTDAEAKAAGLPSVQEQIDRHNLAGRKVWITYQGEEMEAVVVRFDGPLVWVRSHGGHGRALGYKAKDVRRKPLAVAEVV